MEGGEGRETAALCGRWSGLTQVAVLACLEKGKWASGGDEMIVFERGFLATAQLAGPQRLIRSCSGSWCLVASPSSIDKLQRNKAKKKSCCCCCWQESSSVSMWGIVLHTEDDVCAWIGQNGACVLCHICLWEELFELFDLVVVWKVRTFFLSNWKQSIHLLLKIPYSAVCYWIRDCMWMSFLGLMWSVKPASFPLVSKRDLLACKLMRKRPYISLVLWPQWTVSWCVYSLNY